MKDEIIVNKERALIIRYSFLAIRERAIIPPEYWLKKIQRNFLELYSNHTGDIQVRSPFNQTEDNSNPNESFD